MSLQQEYPMLKIFLFICAPLLLTACSSATSRVNQGAADVSYGVNAVENAASTVDRAIATEKRIRERFERK